MNSDKKCKTPWHKHYAVQILIVVAVFVIVFFLFEYSPMLNHGKQGELIWLTAALVFATGVLAGIAWHNFEALTEYSRRTSETSKADLLLRIDHMYGSKEIMKARNIIIDFIFDYREGVYEKNSYDSELDYAAKQLKKMRDKHDNTDGKYGCLLNFLDFLETVAYFYDKREEYVSKEDIRELFGGLVGDYQVVFRYWLEAFNEDSSNEGYPHFANLTLHD